MSSFQRPQRVLLIQNSRSGQGNSQLEAFHEQLSAHGLDVTLRQMEREVPCADLLSDASSFDAVVAAGGDGTVSSVAYTLREHDVPLFIYPAGTANLIAHNLDLPTDADGLLDVLLHGRTLSIDLAEMNINGVTQGFAMMAGAGLDAEMIRESEDLKPKLGVLAYVAGALKQLVPHTRHFKLTLDGREVRAEGAAVLVANFGMVNARLPVTTDVDPTDGQLSVIVVKGRSVLSLLPTLIDSLRLKLHLGDPIFKDHLEQYACREVQVESEPELPVQYDGESIEATTPFTVRVLPKAVRVFTRAAHEDIST